MPPSPLFDLYASAISSFVGSFGGVWANASIALTAASNISAETESFTISFYVTFASEVTLASCLQRNRLSLGFDGGPSITKYGL